MPSGRMTDIDPWVLEEHGVELDRLGRSESLFALANGHLGLRGVLDEGEPRRLNGTYLNGFYESYPLEYGERGYGFAEDGQVVVDVTDGKLIRVQVEDEPVDVQRGEVESHMRRLDLRTGVLEREMVWRTMNGHRVRIRSRRLVSLALRSIAAIAFEVEALDGPVRVALQSNLQANQGQAAAEDDPRKAHQLEAPLESLLHAHRDLRVVLAHRTQRSGLTVAAGMDHRVVHDGTSTIVAGAEPDFGRISLSAQLQPGQPLALTKLLAYHWSGRQTVEWLRDQVDASLASAVDEGFDGLAAEQRQILDAFWARADIEVDGDPDLQQALRFALFHLFQNSRHGAGRGLAAKGLTGTGYDGHTFWDNEMFVLPVLTYAAPDIVRAQLAWRADILDAARERAVQLGLAGAAMPWRTIRGEECSGYWPAGTAAFHVNAAVAEAARRYVAATGDDGFEGSIAAELLTESARLWLSLGHHGDDGAFHLPGVTGPDEYTALVDDNVYTNLMAQQNLWTAADVLERHGDAAQRLGVSADERAAWRAAADAMHVPYDEERGLHPQDARFLEHPRWDFDATPAEDYPLLLHHPYVVLYPRQVVKQADLVLAMHARGDAFTAEEKHRNFDFYEGVTVRDSSLSACTQAVLAAEVGHLGLAEAYLREAAFMDLHDTNGDTRDGLHLASLAGAVIAAVAGLGGLRDHGGRLTFRPRLSPGISRLRFPITVRGTRLRVDIRRDGVSFCVEEGDGLTVVFEDEELSVAPGEDVHRPLGRPVVVDGPAPAQPRHREPGARRAPGHDRRAAKSGAGPTHDGSGG